MNGWMPISTTVFFIYLYEKLPKGIIIFRLYLFTNEISSKSS
jgi:hypothetical protein